MVLPDDCWANVFSFLNIKEMGHWPCRINKQIRQHTTWKIRKYCAKPLHGTFLPSPKLPCVVNDCTASKGAFRGFIVSPYCVQHACQYSCPKILYFKPF